MKFVCTKHEVFFPKKPFLSTSSLSIVKTADHYLYTNCRYPILSSFKELVKLGGELRPLLEHPRGAAARLAPRASTALA